MAATFSLTFPVFFQKNLQLSLNFFFFNGKNLTHNTQFIKISLKIIYNICSDFSSTSVIFPDLSSLFKIP